MEVHWAPFRKDGSRQLLKKEKFISSIIRPGPHHGLIPGYVSIFLQSVVARHFDCGPQSKCHQTAYQSSARVRLAGWETLKEGCGLR